VSPWLCRGAHTRLEVLLGIFKDLSIPAPFETSILDRDNLMSIETESIHDISVNVFISQKPHDPRLS